MGAETAQRDGVHHAAVPVVGLAKSDRVTGDEPLLQRRRGIGVRRGPQLARVAHRAALTAVRPGDHHHVFSIPICVVVERATARDEREPRRSAAVEDLAGGEVRFGHPGDGLHPVGPARAVAELDRDRVAGREVAEPVEGAVALVAVVDVPGQHRRALGGAGAGTEPVPADRVHVERHLHPAAVVDADGRDRRVDPERGEPDAHGRRRRGGLRREWPRTRDGEPGRERRRPLGPGPAPGSGVGRPHARRYDGEHEARHQTGERAGPPPLVRRARVLHGAGQRRAAERSRVADTAATARPASVLTSSQAGTPASAGRPTVRPTARRTASCAGRTR